MSTESNALTPSSRTFYKTVIQIEVLSEASLGSDISLHELHEAITDGPCSGRRLEEVETKLTGPEAAEALLAHGSDPSFFQLTDKGEDDDEDGLDGFDDVDEEE